MINVMVVDDHDLVRVGIERILEDVRGLTVVGACGSGEEALRLIKAQLPHVVLMDAKMPGMSGLEATRKITRGYPEVRVIAVTVCADELFPSRFFKAGASGYLTKGAGLDEMEKAIRVVHAGQRYISPEIAQQMVLKPFSHDSDVSPFACLSERELEIATMVVNCQKVQAISDQLFLSPKTVNSYRYRIFEKLGIESDVELTLLAVRHGMIDPEMVG